jgi:hypothetical protein
MARGGYQPPAAPAPVSGPGKLSRRTDGRQPIQQLPDAAYGEQATFRQDQQGAPMAASPGGAEAGGVMPADLSGVVPMNAPTQQPDEPVTAGAAMGAGPGVDSLGVTNPDNDPSVQQLRTILPTIELMANSPFAGPAFRQFVRRARASL